MMVIRVWKIGALKVAITFISSGQKESWELTLIGFPYNKAL